MNALRWLATALLCACPAMTFAGDIYIHAGRLLADPATGRVETQRTVVVRDARVVAIQEGYITGPGRVIDLREIGRAHV